MIDSSNNADDVEFFSWQQYRKERRKSEKEAGRKQRRRHSKKRDERQKKIHVTKPASTSTAVSNVPATICCPNTMLLDESDRTATTVATMTDHDSSVSTLMSLPEEDIKDTATLTPPSSTVMEKPVIQEQQDDDDNVLDHIVLATSSDIDSAVMEFYKLTGVKPIKTGYFNGMGISKARVAFSSSSSCFLEIIAPDCDREGPIGNLLKESSIIGSSSSLVPFHWAIRKSTTEDLVPKVSKMGYTPDFISMKGPDHDGIIKKWETLYLYNNNNNYDGICPPYFINWDTFDHPCKSLPVVGKLINIQARYPSDDKTHQLLAHTGSTGFTLEEGNSYFEVQFESPKGPISFTADAMTGFKIPGFEDTKNKKKDNEKKDNGKNEKKKEIVVEVEAPAKRVSTASTENGKSTEKQEEVEAPPTNRLSISKANGNGKSKEKQEEVKAPPIKRVSISNDSGKSKKLPDNEPKRVPDNSIASKKEFPPTTIEVPAKKGKQQAPKTTQSDLRNAVSGMAAKSLAKKPKDNNNNNNKDTGTNRVRCHRNKENESNNNKAKLVGTKAQKKQSAAIKVPINEKRSKQQYPRSATPVPPRKEQFLSSSSSSSSSLLANDRPRLSRTAGVGKRASLVVSTSAAEEQAMETSQQDRPVLMRTSAGTGKRGSIVTDKSGHLVALKTPNVTAKKQQRPRSSLVELPTTVFIPECGIQTEPQELWEESILMYPVY